VSRTRPDPRLVRALWGLVSLLAVVAVGLGMYAVLGVDLLPGSRQASDEIFDREAMDAAWMESPEAVEQGTSLGLKPGLRAARVEIPNRPHDLEDATAPDLKEKFQRRRTFTLTTDSQGLRRPDEWTDWEEYASPGTGPRVLCLGPSISLGWGVPSEQSYPSLLADLLGVEVVNAGAPAAEPRGLARWMAVEGKALKPDLVILLLRPDYPAHRTYDAFAQAVSSMARSVAPAPLVVVLPPLSTFDAQIPELEFLHGIKADVLSRDIESIQVALKDRPVLPLTPVFRERAERAHPLGGETLVLLERTVSLQRLVRLPDRQSHADAPPPPPPTVGEDGWIHPDTVSIAPSLLEAFEKDSTLREPLFFDGGHPDAEGYALMAGEIARWLERENLLPWLQGALPD